MFEAVDQDETEFGVERKYLERVNTGVVYQPRQKPQDTRTEWIQKIVEKGDSILTLLSTFRPVEDKRWIEGVFASYYKKDKDLEEEWTSNIYQFFNRVDDLVPFAALDPYTFVLAWIMHVTQSDRSTFEHFEQSVITLTEAQVSTNVAMRIYHRVFKKQQLSYSEIKAIRKLIQSYL